MTFARSERKMLSEREGAMARVYEWPDTCSLLHNNRHTILKRYAALGSRPIVPEFISRVQINDGFTVGR